MYLPSLKGAASDVTFRYVLKLEAFYMNSRVPFDKFKYVVVCGRVSESRLSPYTLPCIMTGCYCKNEVKSQLRFHPKCQYTMLHPPIDCDWLQKVVDDRTLFITRLLKQETSYWCEKCKTLLFDIGTAAFKGCVRQKRKAIFRE
jgi:hypothetical protein